MIKNLIVFALIASLSIVGLQTATASTQNDTEVLPLSTEIADLLQQRGIETGVELIYESPTTIVFRGDIGPNATLALAVDTAKENGYSIDDITVFTPRDEGAAEDVYTVFMSK